MLKLGECQELTVLRIRSNGAYLGEQENGDSVLLPGAQVPAGCAEGDRLEVFLYRDSEDRLIATTRKPMLTLGQVARLPVKQISRIGAFLDWGLEKDLLLPFAEQRGRVKRDSRVLVALYTDRSGRLCATMNVYPYLSADSPYRKDDKVTGTVYEVQEELGAFVAVDDRYFGLIPKQELYQEMRIGQEVTARVLRVRADGKLDLSPRHKAYKQMDDDAQVLRQLLRDYEGELPFTDKADAELIKRETGMSKNAFKRAVGRLLKAGEIEILPDRIRRTGK